MRVEAPALCCVAVPVILIQLYNTTVQSMHRNITRLVMFVESATAQQTSASWRDQKQLKLKAMENNFPSQMQFASCVSLSLPHSASLVEKGYLLFRQPRKPNHAPNTDSIGKSSRSSTEEVTKDDQDWHYFGRKTSCGVEGQLCWTQLAKCNHKAVSAVKESSTSWSSVNFSTALSSILLVRSHFRFMLNVILGNPGAVSLERGSFLNICSWLLCRP